MLRTSASRPRRARDRTFSRLYWNNRQHDDSQYPCIEVQSTRARRYNFLQRRVSISISRRSRSAILALSCIAHWTVGRRMRIIISSHPAGARTPLPSLPPSSCLPSSGRAPSSRATSPGGPTYPSSATPRTSRSASRSAARIRMGAHCPFSVKAKISSQISGCLCEENARRTRNK